MQTIGCYGIGVDRTIAAIIEEHNDEKGIIWPMSVAPFHVIVIAISKKEDTNDEAEKFSAQLEQKGLEVLFDDRNERAGVKLADSELIGVPVRVVFSDKNEGKLEITLREKSETKLLPVDEAMKFVEDFVKAELKKF